MTYTIDLPACLVIIGLLLLMGLVWGWFARGGASYEVRQKMRYRPGPTLSPKLEDYRREDIERGLKDRAELERKLEKVEEKEGG
jgi:hypothetical protein